MNIKKIGKWIRMLSGKGTLHVKKGEGRHWNRDSVEGFYIDYSEKTKTSQFTDSGLPYTKLENGTTAILPITVIQYGLGCYENVLDGEKDYSKGFLRCADYMLQTQATDGSWEAFAAQRTNKTKSSMVQGEGAALLIRAWKYSGNTQYLLGAQKAITFMLKDVKEGGTAEIGEDYIALLEGTGVPMILNGAIYSLFGLYDLWLVTYDKSLKQELDFAINGIKHYLPKYDNGYWSYYCLDKRIASPFYHQLHIVQLHVLAKLLVDDAFDKEAVKYEKYYNNKLCYFRAFIKKAFQKLTEKSDSIAIVE